MGKDHPENKNSSFEVWFETLFKVFFIPLKLHARSFVGDESIAGDLVQDIFLRVWEDRKLPETDVSARGYLYKAVTNKCLNYLKHREVEEKYKVFNELRIRQLELYTDSFIEHHVGVLLEEEMMTRLDRAISQLPPRCREVYRLSREEGLSNREIASRLGISLKAVERQMTRALKSIRVALRDYLALLALLSELIR